MRAGEFSEYSEYSELSDNSEILNSNPNCQNILKIPNILNCQTIPPIYTRC